MPSILDANLAALPKHCYGTLNSTGDLILLKAGEKGYWPAEGYGLAGEIDTYDKLANLLNEQRGTTREQRKAMEAGSIFGFDVPGAHPDVYKLDTFIEDLDAIDKALGDEARSMRRAGETADNIRARFNAAMEVRRQDELVEKAMAGEPQHDGAGALYAGIPAPSNADPRIA